MIEHLRLKEHKALKVGDLTRLGKVNVICGINNSGKTTLLERIASCENILIGRSSDCDENFIERLSKVLDNKSFSFVVTGGMRRTPFEFLDNATDFRKALKKTIEEMPAIFSGDGEAIGQGLLGNASLIASEANRTFQYDIDSFRGSKEFTETLVSRVRELLDDYFTSTLPPGLGKGNVVMVTPKRTLQSSTSLGVVKEVKQGGEGLIEHLFFLKSQLPKTKERSFFEKYWTAFSEVSGSFKFDIEITQKNALRLNFSLVDEDQWRYAEDCGLGLRELMVIVFFALEEQRTLVLIEEPENHLHPEMQRRLLKFLKEDTAEDKQFIITTHSSVFLDSYYVDRIYQTFMSDNYIQIADETSKATLLNDLGYSVSENLVSDLIILVEGSGDKKVLTEFLSKMGLLAEYNIKFWIVNGDNMANLELDAFADKFRIEVLLDKDPSSEPARKAFRAQCKKLNIPVTTLSKYSIESYFPLSIYKETFSDIIRSDLTGFDDNKPVWEQISNRIKKNDLKRGVRKLAAKTELTDIAGTDLERFLQKVKKILIDG